jgi:hypothetical protein
MKKRYTNLHRQFEYVPFPEVGSGSQFHAYDMYDGRVLKLPLTKEETYCVIADRRHNMNPFSAEESATIDNRVHTIINGKGRIPGMITHAFKDATDFLGLIGNPKLIDNTQLLPEDTPNKQWGVGRVMYTQDKVMMVGDLLDELRGQTRLSAGDSKKLRRIIDLYIEQTFKMWSFGYSDYVFKIGDTGITADGDLVLVDIGEYTNDPQFVKRAIADKRWLHSTIPTKIDFPQIPGQLLDYFEEACNNALTVANLEKYWGTNHHCTECTPPSDDDDVLRAFIASKSSEIDLVDRW